MDFETSISLKKELEEEQMGRVASTFTFFHLHTPSPSKTLNAFPFTTKDSGTEFKLIATT
jgi:hypothetical protein